ncbi:hypothetical protein FVEG_00715 [Fusarium verticillioides 7600]|uniref:Uncharacterized protein n=1 Tax=Gibberella moniliformis (strain M3125 / FGSC 7600) TaxID=334819 RepID=W7LN34_GIBM7|nr:hypothetical protein FVEG_00715 [Fusarium verticillioides 7600]EWG36854.1 hypothetical protein FVEG_00715 [Fusarium verticillioides 7600]
MCNSAAQGGFRTDQAEGLCDPHGLFVFISELLTLIGLDGIIPRRYCVRSKGSMTQVAPRTKAMTVYRSVPDQAPSISNDSKSIICIPWSATAISVSLASC